MDKAINYIIEPIKTSNFGYLVFSTNYTRVDECIPEIEQCMFKMNFKGYVLFDLLINNGSDDRYYVAHFNGEKFDYKSFKSCYNINEDIAIASSNFYLNHLEYIDNSFMSKAKKFIIKKELKRVLSSVSPKIPLLHS